MAPRRCTVAANTGSPIVQCPTLGTLGARSIDAPTSRDPPLVAAALGSECSLGDFLEDDLIDRQLRHGLLQPRVLRLELPHPLGLVDPQTTVGRALPKIRLVRHPELLAGIATRLALADQHIDLTQLVNDRLGGKP
jgi:hypothetical protein